MDTSDTARPSRYRSQRPGTATNDRNASAHTDNESIDSQNDPATLNRSRSRYHRKPTISSPSDTSPPPVLPGAAPAPVPVPVAAPVIASENNVAPVALATQVGPVQLVRNAADAFAAHSREYLSSPTPPIAQDRVLTPRADAERRRRLADHSAMRQDSLEPAPLPRAHPVAKDFAPTEAKEKPWTSDAPQQIRATTIDPVQEKSASCFGSLFRRHKAVVHQEPAKPQHQSKERQYIKHGGGGVVPGTDAPKSASNAGSRRVLVECNVSAMQFPIDLETTAADLLQSSANCFSDPIDQKTHVMVESFGKVGIQRPLRRYERIRDIMNSWDDDVQNSLIVMPAVETGIDPALLHSSRAPTQAPVEETFVLWYSQKVGKWDKRHVTLRTDGQLIATKKAPTIDKSPVNICHLSDFDIYTPTMRQASKKIRPPKKLCFAIKSQQKSSMFESTIDFVHFFSTAEQALAIDFYTAIQSWRSWYLTSTLGEGKAKSKQTANTDGLARRQSARSVNHNRHESNATADSRYHIGSFRPLLSEKASFPSEPAELDGTRPARRSSLQHARDHNSRPSMDSTRRPTMDSTSAPFAATGLLGRTYSQRQRDMAARDLPTAHGGLIRQASQDTMRPGTATSLPRRANSSHTRTRAPSMRHRQPLLDLSQGQADPVPAARFQNANAYAALTGAPAPTQVAGKDDPAFVPGGLLEQAGGGWGAGGQGRGVAASGEGPLVDLRTEGEFRDGSLLARLA